MDRVARGLPGPPQWLAPTPREFFGPIGFRCPSRLKIFMGPCTARQSLPLALARGKDDPPFSGGHTDPLELHLVVLRRAFERETPNFQNSPAAVRGPLDASGLLSVDRKGERNQRFWSPRRRKVMPSQTSSLDKGCPAGARCSGKRARGRGRAGKPSGIMSVRR